MINDLVHILYFTRNKIVWWYSDTVTHQRIPKIDKPKHKEKYQRTACCNIIIINIDSAIN